MSFLDLPYDVFNYLVEIGKVSGQDLINLSELYPNRKEDVFKKALKRDFNLKNDSFDHSSEKLYKDHVKIFGNNFNKDKSTVLLVLFSEENDLELNEIDMLLERKYPDFKKYLRRGDIIENIPESGYRSNGVYMFDGEKVIGLNYDFDDYGSPSKEFLVFKEFSPDYWNYELNVNNIYHPNNKSKFYWHRSPAYVVVDKNILRPLVEKGVTKDVEENRYYYLNYVTLEFQNKKYKVTIPDRFNELEELYYYDYGEYVQHFIFK